MKTIKQNATIVVSTGAQNTGLTEEEIMKQAISKANERAGITICAENGSPVYVGLLVKPKGRVTFQED